MNIGYTLAIIATIVIATAVLWWRIDRAHTSVVSYLNLRTSRNEAKMADPTPWKEPESPFLGKDGFYSYDEGVRNARMIEKIDEVSVSGPASGDAEE
jgi:hypothetical protein